MPANTLTGMGLGALLAVAGEAASFDPMTFITGAGVCGAIAWVLLRSQMERAKRDADARDQSEKELILLVKDTTGAQRDVAAKLDETNHLVRDLVNTMKSRPCILKDKTNE